MRRRGKPSALPGGLMKLCAGVVECAEREPYLTAMDRAEQAVCDSCSDMTEEQRKRLVRAIRHNLINRKRYPVERLCYAQELPIGAKRFYRERKRYCAQLLCQLGLLDNPDR